ncbi:CHAT domain-containing protein [Microbacterium mangrovi]|uniref:CHAT domain-containing protein n=1 Tax=Microbacterium mangrovi TaxID=1348253 RepID=UPI00068C56A8|nr:CHAT domain-containing protein [Microbacterium mangrovi]
MAVTVYDDLQLRIDRDADGSYRVLAVAPDGRAARGSFVSPLSDDELDEFVQRVGLARRRGGSTDARMDAIRGVGSALFDSLIKDEVGTVYYSARSAAAERDRGLRITLRLSGSPELMRLPWEFLYKRPRFLAQSTQTPVVRALDVDSAMRPQRLTLPLRILAMVSSPSGYPELDAEAERRNLERALAAPRTAGLVEITWLERATLGDLARHVAELDDVHVLHYIGHGAYDEATDSGILVLETPQGRAHDVSGEEIGAILQDETSLRLVVLNACEGARTSHVDPFSGVAASLVNFDIPAVIGMQFEITDDAAIAFSESLYTGLAHGLPVDAALAPARRAIVGAMLATEFGTPVLYLRDGDARLFDVQGPVPSEEPLTEESLPSGASDDTSTPRDVPVGAVEQVAEPLVGVESPTQPHPSDAATLAGPSVTLAATTAWAGAALLVVSAVVLLIGSIVGVGILFSASAALQTLAAVALAVHSALRPGRDATSPAYLFGAGAVLSAVVLLTVDGNQFASAWASIGYGVVLMVVAVWLVRARRASPFAGSRQVPAAGVLAAGIVSTTVEIVWLSGANWSYNWLWPLSTVGMAAGYAVSGRMLKREARTPRAGSSRALLPVSFAWSASLALVVRVVAALAADPTSTEALVGGEVAQALALVTLAVYHAVRPRRDGRPAVIGYTLAAVASFAGVAVVIAGQHAYELLAALPWTDLVTGILLGAVGVWLSAVGRARGGPFGRSLWIPGPFTLAAGALTALVGSVAIIGSSDIGAVIRWIWPIAVLGMAVGYALSALALRREASVEASVGSQPQAAE